jgi:hypothetical protein
VPPTSLSFFLWKPKQMHPPATLDLPPGQHSTSLESLECSDLKSGSKGDTPGAHLLQGMAGILGGGCREDFLHYGQHKTESSNGSNRSQHERDDLMNGRGGCFHQSLWNWTKRCEKSNQSIPRFHKDHAISLVIRSHQIILEKNILCV